MKTLKPGGVLLGYRENESIFRIIESVDGDYNAIHNKTHFKYDYQYVKHLSQVISELYVPQLEVVGFWHTHNNNYNPPFSEADKAMHSSLLDICKNDIVSLIIQNNCGDYSASVYIINRNYELEDELMILERVLNK